MTKSTTHKNVYVALAAAQAQMGPLVKGSENPHFKSRYADLADLVQAVRGPLTENGLTFFHRITAEGPDERMVTVLYHGESDTHIECAVRLIVAKNDMQGMKSATTYAKRIGLESVTGVAPEDDDGNAAAKAAPPAPSRAQVDRATQDLSSAATLDSLRTMFEGLPMSIKSLPAVIDAKDARKRDLQGAPKADDLAKQLGDDEINY